ncbi:hypothetical protein QBC34DRAFT_496553 [Podospora aff. communis PSN243]|uniref:RING-type domain-containing protein n=1 Tax=Podospora aff. communis PSN243 TaxID=3040156 RepID=A0AAV9GI30_9PEZI|nr:hypothetical protein QBC34DRAFT_496553 [Podospora aff. communis PSN243]
MTVAILPGPPRRESPPLRRKPSSDGSLAQKYIEDAPMAQQPQAGPEPFAYWHELKAYLLALPPKEPYEPFPAPPKPVVCHICKTTSLDILGLPKVFGSSQAVVVPCGHMFCYPCWQTTFRSMKDFVKTTGCQFFCPVCNFTLHFSQCQCVISPAYLPTSSSPLRNDLRREIDVGVPQLTGPECDWQPSCPPAICLDCQTVKWNDVIPTVMQAAMNPQENVMREIMEDAVKDLDRFHLNLHVDVQEVNAQEWPGWGCDFCLAKRRSVEHWIHVEPMHWPIVVTTYMRDRLPPTVRVLTPLENEDWSLFQRHQVEDMWYYAEEELWDQAGI